jgi:hypothetical protein
MLGLVAVGAAITLVTLVGMFVTRSSLYQEGTQFCGRISAECSIFELLDFLRKRYQQPYTHVAAAIK